MPWKLDGAIARHPKNVVIGVEARDAAIGIDWRKGQRQTIVIGHGNSRSPKPNDKGWQFHFFKLGRTLLQCERGLQVTATIGGSDRGR